MRTLCELLTVLLYLLSVTVVSADVLILNNGDRISGQLQAVSEGKLTWTSDHFGDVVVQQSSVSLIETRQAYQISVGRKPAYSNCLLSIEGEEQVMLCDEKLVDIADWRLVTTVAKMQLLERDIAKFSGETLMGLESASGNTREQGYDIDAQMEIRYDLTRHKLSAEYDIRETDKVTTKNQGQVGYGFDWFFTDNWFFNANTSYQSNRFKNLQQRKAGGIGLGLQIIDSNIMALSLEAGVTHIYEAFDVEETEEYDSLRWQLDYQWQIGGTGTEFFHRHTLFQSFDVGDDWEWASDTGVRLPIKGRLKSVLKLEYDYRNQPAGEDEPIDRVWSLGVGYDW